MVSPLGLLGYVCKNVVWKLKCFFLSASDECQTKYGNANAWRYCTKVFDMLTVAAVSSDMCRWDVWSLRLMDHTSHLSYGFFTSFECVSGALCTDVNGFSTCWRSCRRSRCYLIACFMTHQSNVSSLTVGVQMHLLSSFEQQMDVWPRAKLAAAYLSWLLSAVGLFMKPEEQRCSSTSSG